MGKLWAFGCSHTFGHGLEDIRDTPNWDDGPASKLAWPKALADKMGMEVENRSRPGSANRSIAWRALNAIPEMDPENDIAVILWTYNNRTSLYMDKKRMGPDGNPTWKDLNEVLCSLTVHNMHLCTPPDDWHEFDQLNWWWQRFLLEYDWERDRMYDSMVMQELVNVKLPIPVYNFCMPLMDNEVFSGIYQDDFKEDWMDMDYLGYPHALYHQGHDKAPDGAHMGPLAHQAVAEQFYKIIQEKRNG